MAVASIEEIGKSLLAFDGQGQNLADSAVTATLRRAMEDHSQKIAAAFSPVLLTCQDTRGALMPTIDLMVQLTLGREASMHADILYAESKVQLPRSAVRDIAAKDYIRLSFDCLFNARNPLAEELPRAQTHVEAQLFAMKSEQFRKIFNKQDFWWCFVAQSEVGNRDFAAPIIAYQREYLSKGKAFECTSINGLDTQIFSTS